MTRPALTIRLPEPDDAPALAAVHVRSWRETYAGMLPERFYDETAQRRRRTMWDGLLRDETGRSAVRVAEVAGRIVGFAAANARAIRFYERNGFRADGTETVDPRLSDLRELRMVR